MRKDNKIRGRLLALMLSLALVVTYMPTALFVYAENDDAAVTQEDQTGTATDETGGDAVQGNQSDSNVQGGGNDAVTEPQSEKQSVSYT